MSLRLLVVVCGGSFGLSACGWGAGSSVPSAPLSLSLPADACEGHTRAVFELPLVIDAATVDVALSEPEPATVQLIASCVQPLGDSTYEARITGGGWVRANRRASGLTLAMALYDEDGAELVPAPTVSSASFLQRLVYEPGDDLPLAINALRGPALDAAPARAVLTILGWDDVVRPPRSSRGLTYVDAAAPPRPDGAAGSGPMYATGALPPQGLRGRSNPPLTFEPRRLIARIDAYDGTQRSDERFGGRRIASASVRRTLSVEGTLRSEAGTLRFAEAAAVFTDEAGEVIATSAPQAVLPIPLPVGRGALVVIEHEVREAVWDRARGVTVQTRGDVEEAP